MYDVMWCNYYVIKGRWPCVFQLVYDIVHHLSCVKTLLREICFLLISATLLGFATQVFMVNKANKANKQLWLTNNYGKYVTAVKQVITINKVDIAIIVNSILIIVTKYLR